MENRGYISRQFTAWCGVCSHWDQHSANNLQVFIKLIQRFKWLNTRDCGWICPGCRKKREEMKK